EPAAGIRSAFVHAVLVRAVERDAGTAGVDQLAHAVLLAPFDDMARAKRVDFEKLAPWSPDAGNASDMKHDVDTFAGGEHEIAPAKIDAAHLDAERVKGG